jgi:hypothetical protein
MRRNHHLVGIKMLLAASVLFITAIGGSVVYGQTKPTAPEVEGELFKTTVPTPAQDPVPGGQRGTEVQRIRRGLVGSPVSGSVRTQGAQVQPGDTLTALTAGPISNCALNGGGGITCNIFETDASGNPSEISNVINLPMVVTGGYLVLKDNPAAPDSDQSQWSDVLVFAPTGGNATTVQMFSAGCNTANPNDRSCFPTFATVTGDPDSGFINETKGAVTVFTAAPNIYNIFSIDDNPPVRPFTLAGSVGTVDEDSAAIVQFRNFTTTFLPAASGSIHIRYNITAVNDIARFCPATQSVVRVRFRNSDNTGVNARVSFEIHSTNITSGGNTILYTFTSDARGNGASFTSASDSPAIDFDFSNNLYWIEATVYRVNATQLADLGSIQIWEAAGTACP